MAEPSKRSAAKNAISMRRPDAEVWRQALRAAGGDARRIEVLADGSVVVRNHRVR